MTLLLDTHIVVWWWLDDPALPGPFGRMLDDAVGSGSTVAVSAISLWEIAMLTSRGQLRVGASVDAFVDDVEGHPAVRILPLTGRIALESTRLGEAFPRDPADRIIAATARCHALRLMTADARIRDSKAVALA
jgi:PIN domain nuclease of toxin-antitoxin system